MQIELRKKWKRLVGFAAIWAFILFPIPFLPVWGYSIDPESLRALIIIGVVVTAPLTALFIFMK